jgi:hypothetical protein
MKQWHDFALLKYACQKLQQTPLCKGIKEISLCIWSAPYIHECHSYKQGEILWLLQKSGRKKLCLLVDVRWYLNLTKKLEELFSLDN